MYPFKDWFEIKKTYIQLHTKVIWFLAIKWRIQRFTWIQDWTAGRYLLLMSLCRSLMVFTTASFSAVSFTFRSVDKNLFFTRPFLIYDNRQIVHLWILLDIARIQSRVDRKVPNYHNLESSIISSSSYRIPYVVILPIFITFLVTLRAN